MLQNRHKIVLWLVMTGLLIVAMILLGGATRLTESGLSIVEWKPISGILPTLSEAAWIHEFDHYKHFPEYAQKHMDMTLSDFKFIYFMEYSHRLLGRILGLVFLIPLLFLWKGMPLDLKRRSILLLALGGAQGLMGWIMVKSGLVDIPYVSHYRLAAHLGLAFVLLAVIVSTLCKVLNSQGIRGRETSKHSLCLNKIVHITLAVVSITIVYGAFVAGLRAGKIYNTFPLMGGDWIPYDWDFLKPLWRNAFENQATVQWIHRVLATFTLGLSIACSLLLWRLSCIKQSVTLGLLILMQYLLGIKTLIFIVPIPLALMHQMGAVIVWSYLIYLKTALRMPQPI